MFENNEIMSKGGDKKVVIVMIQTCIDVNLCVIKWLLNALSLNHGDKLILLGLLQHVTSPTLSLHSAAKLLGYKGKEDPNKVYGSTRKTIYEELRRRKEEYRKNHAIMQLHRLCELQKVKVSVEVEASSSHKAAFVRAAKRLCATWIIIDREMKKEKQYLLDRLSCGISCMKNSNTIVEIRGPIDEQVSYDEMIPSYSFEEDLSPHTIIPSSKHTPKYDQISATNSIIEQEVTENEFENSICSVCNNKRPKIGLQRDFSYIELHEATKGFSTDNFLSEGGFGFVFKGKLKDGLKIAVKQHKVASLQGEKEFKSEVHLLSQARHQNLVVLLGSCSEGSHRLLVYEYVCNGSLEKNLSDDSSSTLDWDERLKIALGAAKGLEYLHSRNIVHRDMRPGNILIRHDHESLLGDFGLAKEQQDDTLDKGVVGTLGYVAPEYAESGKMSTKTDVYSFGVVLLQLITGLRTTDEIPQGKSLVGWAKPLLETKNYPDLIDKRIADSHDVHQLFWMVLVAEKCLEKNPDNRWTMKQVVHNLNCIKEGKTNFITDFLPIEWNPGSTIPG